MLVSSKTLATSSVLLFAFVGGTFAGCAPVSGPDDSGSSAGGTSGVGGVDTGAGGADTGAGGTDTGAGGSVTGTGATTGVGGGTGTGGGTATGGGSSADCSTLPSCEDFESTTAGSPPSVADWTVRTNNGTVVVDDTQAHTGTKSVRIESTGGMAYLVNTSALPAPAGKIYVRAFVKWNESVPEGHVGYVALSKNVNDENNEIRFGGQHKFMPFNSVPSDKNVPDPWSNPCPECVAPTVGEWTCVEVMFDTANGAASAWVGDNTEVSVTQAEIPDTFPSPGAELKIGFRSWNGDAQKLWYDDIKVGYDRIGCD